VKRGDRREEVGMRLRSPSPLSLLSPVSSLLSSDDLTPVFDD